MLNYKQIWHGIKPIRWLNKFNLTQILERHYTKPGSHHHHHCETAVWISGKQLGRNQSTLVDTTVQQRNPGSQKRNRFGATSLEQEAQRAQVHQVDQAWRVYCCPCIPTTFSSGLFTAWRVAERFYAEGFGFLFDNTSCVVLVFVSSFSFIFAFYYLLWVVILIGLDCFTNSVLQLLFIFRTLVV